MLVPLQLGSPGDRRRLRAARHGPECGANSAEEVGTVLAEVANLAVAFPEGPESWRRVVDGASLRVERQQSVGLVGESGSGKTLTALSLLRLVPEPGRIVAGAVRVGSSDVLAASEAELGRLRGGAIGFVFQEPSLALDPVRAVAGVIGEAARLHLRLDRATVDARIDGLLDEVGLDAASTRKAFPHQLSGGQRQRVLIAAALSGDPSLLVADEPTAALDTVARLEILALLERLRRDRGLGLLLVSHDLGAVARAADRITVMYAGETVESGPSEAVLRRPLHPYTRGLIAAQPGVGAPGKPWPTIPGRPPRPAEWGAGCRFAPRCPQVMPRCSESRPALTGVAADHAVRCYLHADAREPDG